MITSRPAILTAAAVALLLVAACGGGDDGALGPVVVGAPDSTGELAQLLRERGFAVEEVGEVSCPFFSGTALELVADGDDVETLEYADPAALIADAMRIQPDGRKIETQVGDNLAVTDIAFNEPPHYFRSEHMIVLYVGSEPGLLATLEEAFGPQFAGE